MNNLQKVVILLTFFSLWITSYLINGLQNIVGFFFIFSFGILHGANDLIIIGQLKNKNNKMNKQKLLISYLLFVFTIVILFALIPSFALLSFIIVSSYHFGEQHWNNLKEEIPKLLRILFYTFYGLFILTLLFYFHQNEVQLIIKNIAQVIIPLYLFDIIFYTSCIFLVLLYSYICLKSKLILKNSVVQLLYISVLCITFKIGSLIWSFTIYFILWHSIPSLYDQITYLYGQFNVKNFVLYFKSAFVYWIISLFGIGFLYIFLKEERIFNALFFSFLAAITFPHVLVILKMFKNRT